MNRPVPKAGEQYMHFKDRRYQVLCVAEHTETGEKMVVYQALYGTFACFVRPLAAFMDEVDHVKYPYAAQKYRFELAGQEERKPEEKKLEEKKPEERQIPPEASSDEPQADPLLLRFLDADTLEQKYQIIKSSENAITDRLIDDFAVVLDLVIPDGNLEFRYYQLLSSIRTMQKYEMSRFRR